MWRNVGEDMKPHDPTTPKPTPTWGYHPRYPQPPIYYRGWVRVEGGRLKIIGRSQIASRQTCYFANAMQSGGVLIKRRE